MATQQEYEVYLAEQIRLGLSDSEAGRLVSKEEMNIKMDAFFAKLEQEQVNKQQNELRR